MIRPTAPTNSRPTHFMVSGGQLISLNYDLHAKPLYDTLPLSEFYKELGFQLCQDCRDAYDFPILTFYQSYEGYKVTTSDFYNFSFHYLVEVGLWECSRFYIFCDTMIQLLLIMPQLNSYYQTMLAATKVERVKK